MSASLATKWVSNTSLSFFLQWIETEPGIVVHNSFVSQFIGKLLSSFHGNPNRTSCPQSKFTLIWIKPSIAHFQGHESHKLIRNFKSILNGMRCWYFFVFYIHQNPISSHQLYRNPSPTHVSYLKRASFNWQRVTLILCSEFPVRHQKLKALTARLPVHLFETFRDFFHIWCPFRVIITSSNWQKRLAFGTPLNAKSLNCSISSISCWTIWESRRSYCTLRLPKFYVSGRINSLFRIF